MNKKMCYLYVDGKLTSKHVIPEVKPGNKNFYRDTISMSAFSDRECEIFYNAIQKKEILRKRVNVLNYKEYEREGDHDHEKDIPIFNHENIKDFYLAIGYDVKKKKYFL